MLQRATTTGAAFAIATCALWALSFVSPIVLADFSPYSVTLGRYAVFGVVSLGLLLGSVGNVRALLPSDWLKAAWLAAIGHLAYYFFLATGIQLSDVPAPTVVIGLLPLTVPILANLRERELPWQALSIPLLGIGAGLVLINVDQYLALGATESSGRYTLGIASAVMALGCWTWYGVANSAYLKAGQHITATAWTIAQGVSLIPLVGIGIIVLAAFDVEPRAPGSDAGRWTTFAVVSLIVGIGSTWLATLCWSRASRLLPTTLAGQFIVCTPVAAMIYGSLYRQSLPSPAVTLGVLLLTGAVLLAIRAIQRPSPATP